MEVEVLVVCVVVQLGHLDEAGPPFAQPAGQQAMPAEVVFAVSLEIPRGLLGDVEGVALLDELGGPPVGVV